MMDVIWHATRGYLQQMRDSSVKVIAHWPKGLLYTQVTMQG